MKLSVNRNIIWCELFVKRLAELGVKHVCISPGSRSTPLTLAFASNKSIKHFPIIDERSSAFFALGIAKQTNSPVAIVTTSGTAVAELYPAIIEAYYQRVPLIICTADRPRSLRNSGANQTINQQNIYKNHIRFFKDAGLPNLRKLKRVSDLAESAVRYSWFLDKGPVHINFPFEKPFEPKSYTDQIDSIKLDKIFKRESFRLKYPSPRRIDFKYLADKFYKTSQGLILVGYNNYQKGFIESLNKLSKLLGYPIYYDGSCSLRFNSSSKVNFIDNFISMVRSNNFQKFFDPKIIIQFGSAPTSNVLLEYFKNSKAEKILVNEFGDRYDPSLTAKVVLRINPTEYCNSIIQELKSNTPRDSCWQIDFTVMNNHLTKMKNEFLERAKFPFEGRVVTELFNALPENSNLFISNSLPIRDTDFFATVSNKKINIFTNRGASGIDGIVSTALGIVKTSKKPSYLLTGDLALFHDINSLHNAVKYKIPLTIILINNNGGGIFESLPISNYKKFLKENFLTPLELDISKLVKAYGGNFYTIKNWTEMNQKIKSVRKNNLITVLEIKTNARESKRLRDKFWAMASNKIDSYINEIKS